MVEEILSEAGPEGIPPADLVTTVSTLTVEGIASSLEVYVFPRQAVDEIVLCGGGVRNRWLRSAMEARLEPRPVLTTDDLGFPTQAVEATAFAVLAYLTFTGQAGNLPSATGARQAVPLGKIIPGKRFSGLQS